MRSSGKSNLTMKRKAFQCDLCDKVFSQKGHQKSHKTIHTYKCDECSKLFSRSQHLKVHKQICINATSKNIPFKCDYSPKVFSISGNLKIHIRMHTGEKPFKCDQCNKSFSQFEDLKGHKKICHKSTSENIPGIEIKTEKTSSSRSENMFCFVGIDADNTIDIQEFSVKEEPLNMKDILVKKDSINEEL